MAAVVTDDATTGGNNPVEYYFDCISGNGVDSGWIGTEPGEGNWYVYEVAFSTVHAVYRVKARDAVGNETGWSQNWFTGDPPPPPAGP